MNYIEWENRLTENLKSLPTAEMLKITSYYREIYGDKLDAGMTEESILAEFGSPQSCAEKILAENASENNEAPTSNAPAAPPVLSKKQTAKGIILAVLFTLFAGAPLAVILAAIILSLGAVCVSGSVGILAGFVYIFIALFNAMGAGIAAHVGMAIGAMGICGFLGLGSYFATKYSAIYSYKLMKYVYRGIIK